LKNRCKLCFVYLACVLLSGWVYASEKIDFNVSNDNPVIEFNLKKTSAYRYFFLENPERLIVDLEHAKFEDHSANIESNDYFTRVRGTTVGGFFRLVFDLRHEVSITAEPSYNKETTLLKFKIKNQVNTPPPTSSTRKTLSIKRKNKTLKELKKKEDIHIVIDAGHGGRDPGAISSDGVLEKDIVLAVGRELAILLNREKNISASMVRKTDLWLGLKERRDRARSRNADLFISLHADAFTDESVKGASVYVLSEKGASSAMAKFLSTNEISADHLGHLALQGKGTQLTKVLVDLAMDEKVQSSNHIAKYILQELSEVTELHSKKVENAAFAVLKTPDMPSVLIELGFISNKAEAIKLNERTQQKKLAHAIYKAVRNFYSATPVSK
jgi:N-acetylmuramoyl-L-alanine amidase